MCTMNATIYMYDCMQMENSARVGLYIFNTMQHTRGIIHWSRTRNAATKIDIIRSAGFKARIELDGLNVYKSKHIWTVFMQC